MDGLKTKTNVNARSDAALKQTDRRAKQPAQSLRTMDNLSTVAETTRQKRVAEQGSRALDKATRENQAHLGAMGVDTTVYLKGEKRAPSAFAPIPKAPTNVPGNHPNAYITKTDHGEGVVSETTYMGDVISNDPDKPTVQQAMIKRMAHETDALTLGMERQTELRDMREVTDIDLAAKAKLADPRHIAEMARVRVAEQFEKKRLLNSFRKPSNPIMMIRGGSAIYRGGPSEEDQIDMLEEQTFRHLAKRKRLGMPLMD